MQQLLDEVRHLDADSLERLKQQIAQREDELRAQQHPQTAAEWSAVIDQFLDDFWGDTPAEAQKAIVEAIRIKN
ncbi:MAG: hypothetical protein IT322_00640 [Anaerolineae bacterium]|nr:hypothetical protein [Anaerolineae bacterium]